MIISRESAKPQLSNRRSFAPLLSKIEVCIERPRSLESMLSDLKKQPFYRNQMGNSLRVVEERKAVYGDLGTDFPQQLWTDLPQSIHNLYSHQVKGMGHIENGHNLIITTSTSR